MAWQLRNAEFSEGLDELISKYLAYCEKLKKVHAERRNPSPDHQMRLDGQKEGLKKNVDNRAYTTLEKWIGRKRKYLDLLHQRYNVEDIPLTEMEYSFIGEVFKYIIVQHEVIENTAMK